MSCELRIQSRPDDSILTSPDTVVSVYAGDNDVNTIWYVYLTPVQ